ncbi:MFS transporter [Escherichia coli]
MIAVFNIAVMASVYFWVPDIRDEAKGKLREQFHFLRSPAPWLIFAATMFGNAGVFAWFSYVKPYMMFISGFSETAMTFIMMLVGLGMVLGNMLSGRISGRYSPLRIAAVTDFIIVLALLMLFLRRHENNVAYFCFYLLRGIICPFSTSANIVTAKCQRRRVIRCRRWANSV